jgi:Spy/CpxP family protein refolding chaperone
MKSRYFKALAVALLLAVVAAIGVSQTVKRSRMHGDGMFAEGMFGEGMPGTGMHSGHMMGFLARKLDLTDAQQAQVKDIMTKEKPTFQPLMLQMVQNHQRMRQMVMGTGFDEAKVRELASQQTQTMTELTVQRARVASELLQVLTPDQKAKLTTMINEHEQRFMNRMQGETQGQGQTQSQ